MPKLVNLKGQRFGRLRVTGRGEDNAQGQPRWFCDCDCGAETLVAGVSLRHGHTKSCGCLSAELSAERRREGATHGHARKGALSPTYSSYEAMKARCERPSHIYYANYGGRGIAICERWRSSFETFLADMGECPEGMSLDRIDNDGPYEPGNCRWATILEQARNRRDTRIIEHDGRALCIAEWARETGLREHVIRYRADNGWTPSEILTTPVGGRSAAARDRAA